MDLTDLWVSKEIRESLVQTVSKVRGEKEVDRVTQGQQDQLGSQETMERRVTLAM